MGMLLVPVTIAITAVIKLYIDSKYAPLVAMAVGIALSGVVPNVNADGSLLLGGIVVGLTAAGVYSGVKSLMSEPSGMVETSSM